MQAEIDWLRALHLRGVRIAASCSGTFLLAATGLLDGHRATTSWWLAAAMRQAFPDVVLESEQMMVEDGGLVTTGAATAIYQLILRLIADTGGDELAQQTARMLVIDAERQSQAPYVSEALIQRPRSSLSERADRVLAGIAGRPDHRSPGSRNGSTPASAACCATSRSSTARARSRISSACAWSARRPCSKLRISPSSRSSNAAATATCRVSASCSSAPPP